MYRTGSGALRRKRDGERTRREGKKEREKLGLNLKERSNYNFISMHSMKIKVTHHYCIFL